MYLARKRFLIPIVILISVVWMLCGTVDVQALFTINPTVRTGYTVLINGKESNNGYIATYSGTAYIPLNRLAHDLGMQYSISGNTAAFGYEDTILLVDYTNKTAQVNGQPYELQFGTIQKNIGGVQHLFFNIKDIENIFGIVTEFDEAEQEIILNTGFGILDVSYDLGIGEGTEDTARQQLLEYATKIANKTGCIIAKNDTKAHGSLDGLFQSLNAPISKKEFESGISVAGVTTETAQRDDIQHLMNLKFLTGLSQLTVIPEYFGCYDVSNGKNAFQVVGAFYKVDGLETSNVDLGVAAIATIQDTLGIPMDKKYEEKIQSMISASASSARSKQHYVVAIIQNNTVKVVDVF